MSAIWSGIGGGASTIGGGLTQMRNQQDNLAMLGQIYGGGGGAKNGSGTQYDPSYFSQRMGTLPSQVQLPSTFGKQTNLMSIDKYAIPNTIHPFGIPM
jgi:hypothetical protein